MERECKGETQGRRGGSQRFGETHGVKGGENREGTATNTQRKGEQCVKK